LSRSKALESARNDGGMLVTMTVADLRVLVAQAVSDALAAHEPAPQPALLTQDALAQVLGCSTRTVYTMRQEGLPTVWLLESPRFELASVLEWLRRRDAAEPGLHVVGGAR
jgi:phage terminase Nu1 subunit (DNA packaging protein)